LYTKFLRALGGERGDSRAKRVVFSQEIVLHVSIATHMSELFADRFMRVGASWIDIATGAAARVFVAPAGAGSAVFAWNDMCATLALLRHPLLNQLVDYGASDARNTFEAYSVGPPVRTGSLSGARALAHATRFLEANGICLTSSRASLLVRPVAGGAGRAGRTLGDHASTTPCVQRDRRDAGGDEAGRSLGDGDRRSRGIRPANAADASGTDRTSARLPSCVRCRASFDSVAPAAAAGTPCVHPAGSRG
jgi:hypothetical protein